uniref:Uncharacterized protein n=1 Tax=Aegilops tauschii subsp. strangulata TaxID=200361 RepID=A0A453A489_AEGTS
MAASLRAAATRMLRPAVHPGEGLRRVFRTQQLSKSTRTYEEGSRVLSEYQASQIQQRKEQLYDLIAGAEPNSDTYWLNRTLLKDLSTQVKPRPEDPQWWCKITRRKTVFKWTASVGILVTSAVTYCALASRPEMVRYGDYLVTAESVPMIQERLHQLYGHRPVATAEGVSKQAGYQPDATAEGVSKQAGYQPVGTAESVSKQAGYQPVATAEGVSKQDGYQPVATAEGMSKQYGYQPIPTAEGV